MRSCRTPQLDFHPLPWRLDAAVVGHRAADGLDVGLELPPIGGVLFRETSATRALDNFLFPSDAQAPVREQPVGPVLCYRDCRRGAAAVGVEVIGTRNSRETLHCVFTQFESVGPPFRHRGQGRIDHREPGEDAGLISYHHDVVEPQAHLWPAM